MWNLEVLSKKTKITAVLLSSAVSKICDSLKTINIRYYIKN